MSDVTRILNQIDHGDANAADQLLPLVYDELRQLAAMKLRDEKPGQTLQATALVHEAFLRLAGDRINDWKSRRYFFGAAAEAMRRILIDRARRKQRPKHGGDHRRVELEEPIAMTNDRSQQLLVLEEALDKLSAEAADKAEFVKLRYFAGLSHQEAAQVVGISRATADRYWAYAKAFLYSEMKNCESD